MLSDIQQCSLDLALELKNICEQNNLKYFISGGTVLGSVRHSGFIPWDDDIDFAMPRSDYEKLKTIIKNNKSSRYWLVTYENNQEYNEPNMKFVDKDTLLLDETTLIPQKVNVWVDIFPLDGLPSNEKKRQRYFKKLLFLRMIYQFSNIKHINTLREDRKLIERVLIKIAQLIPLNKIFNTKKCLKIIDNYLKNISYEEANYVFVGMGIHKEKEIFLKSVYEPGQLMDFENEKFIGPHDKKIFLTQFYGDYLKIPSTDKQIAHKLTVVEWRGKKK